MRPYKAFALLIVFKTFFRSSLSSLVVFLGHKSTPLPDTL
jgi:hypothetical protein